MFQISKLLILFSLLLAVTTPSYADYSQREDVKKFIKQFSEKNNFDLKKLTHVFSQVKKQSHVLEAMSKPAEKVLSWYQYKKIFLTSKRISRGVLFFNQYKDTLLKAEKEYGVPSEIITAIIGIETYYGKITGSNVVLDTLVTLAFDYPKRAKFFTKELEHYLILSEQENWTHQDIKGSYAGAMGLGQFIASSYRHYAIDYNNDGKINLFDPVDAIGSVARYFNKHHWHEGEKIIEPLYIDHIDEKYYSKSTRKPNLSAKQLKPLGIALINRKYQGKYNVIALKKNEKDLEYWLGYYNFYVITRYNHSNLYAMSAYQLSRELKKRIDKNN